MPDYLNEKYWEKKEKKGRSKRGGKLYTRYDPTSGEKLRIARNDPRYDETLTPAQWRREESKGRDAIKSARTPSGGDSWIDQVAKDVSKDVGSEVVKNLRKPKTKAQRLAQVKNKEALGAAGKALLQIGKTPVSQLVKAGGALAIGSTAALAIIAGAASYYGTTWIINKLAEAREAKTPAAIKFHAAMAYRKAREDAAAKLKRPLNGAEQKILGDEFKAQLRRIGG
jgi:hypothetical protein